MARSARRDARAILDDYVERGTTAFVNVAKGVAEDPSDRRLHALFTRTTVDLERLIRLREGLARRGPR